MSAKELGVGAAPEGRVEVDEVEPLRALLLPGEGGLDRVAELPAAAGDALDELDGATVDDVDRGQDLESRLVGHGSPPVVVVDVGGHRAGRGGRHSHRPIRGS